MTWENFEVKLQKIKGVSSNNIEINKVFVLAIIVLITITSNYGYIKNKYSLHRSEFTDPPNISTPIDPAIPETTITPPPQGESATKHCNENSSNLEEGVHCFKNKYFTQAKKVFTQAKKIAIENENEAMLLSVYMYLAFVDIETHKNADTNIKHLFFLNPEFNIESQDISNKIYLKKFKRVRENGRNINDIEIDDFTKKEFIKVIFCSDHCKNSLWQETHYQIAKPSDTEADDLECSINGSCEQDLNCSLLGTCEKDLDCSLDGNCSN